MPAQPLVLVADDIEDNRVIFRTVLEHRGYRVIVAKDGREVVELARRHRPDLVIMDLQMPKLTGMQASTELKKHPETQSIPVLGISAFDVEEKELERAGFCAFVAKPIAPLHLARAVRLCLDETAAGREWFRLKPSELSQDA